MSEETSSKESVVLVDDEGQIVDASVDSKSGRMTKLKRFLKASKDASKKVGAAVKKAIQTIEKTKTQVQTGLGKQKKKIQKTVASFRASVQSLTPRAKGAKKESDVKQYEKKIGDYFEKNVSEAVHNLPKVKETNVKPKKSLLDELVAGGWLETKSEDEEEVIELNDDPLNELSVEDPEETVPERDYTLGNEKRVGELLNTPAEESDLYTHPLFNPSVASLETGQNTVEHIRALSAPETLQRYSSIIKLKDAFPENRLGDVPRFIKDNEKEDELMNRIIEWHNQKQFLEEKKRYIKELLGITAAERLFDFKQKPKPEVLLEVNEKKVEKSLSFKSSKTKVKGLMKAKLSVKDVFGLFDVKEAPDLFKKKLLRLR